ncbi:4382_t:CDS:10 [Acaulospora morrowiae]|uniref:4382_t:CDS:1 n=1 Tax=Acaulospora morrowiae TaxID=94023 RepID=A0A9N8VCN5_9GLOM|nr:4382_t:CDS:10 [Acaulospora morrowiae]
MAPTKSLENSLFHTIILEAGLKLEGSAGVHELVVEPSTFHLNLIQKLKNHPQYPDPAIGTFLDELQEYLDTGSEKFKACLQPPSVKGKSIYGSTADSLIRVLLSIDFFQANLIDQLLERLPTFISDTDNDIIESPIPRLILQQLKWLDNIVDSRRLTEKILEMIPITPLGIQREIITSLPDIILDSEQKTVIKELTELIDQNHRLIVPILDALPHFTLHEDLMTNVKSTVYGRLESADLDDLAIIVKFLLHTASPIDAEMVIRQIRDKVDFHSIGKLQSEQSTSKRRQKRRKELMPEALILDSIKKGLNIHKFVMNAWLKEISDIETERNHKIIDILILFLLHSMPSIKKKVEAIFCKKISSGLFSKNLLETTITFHFEGLRDYFNDILTLSESLLRSSQQQNTVARAACTLYRSAFMVFEPHQQQEVIASLVSHIGSGSPTEIESTLSVLSHLVDKDIKRLSRFSIFVKGLLDYLENLNLDQIRILFDVIGKLAYEDANYDSNTGGLLAEFSIVIQKQLSNPNEKYKQIGVIGALALVRILGSKSTANISEGSANKISEKFLDIAKENITKIERHCARSMSCLAFAYDELSCYISSGILDCELVDWISDKIETSFSDIFIVDEEDVAKLKEDEYHLKGIPIETWMECEMDCDNEEKPKVNIYPMLCETYVPANLRTQHSIKRDNIICCCSMLKLMQASLKFKEDGNLYSIGVLLAAGILMYESVDANDMKSGDYSREARETVCNALFYSINWCRETVSDFWGQDKDICKNVVIRLRHIIELEKRLNAMLEITPTFQPYGFFMPSPSKNIKLRNTTTLPSGSAQRNLIKTGRTVRRSGISKSKVLSTRRVIETEKNEENKVSEDYNSMTPNYTSVEDLRLLMREFDLSVFGMLEYFNFKKPSCDKEDDHVMNADDSFYLFPEEIVYLLNDLNRKLEFKISPPVTPLIAKKVKKGAFGNKHDGFTLISRMKSSDVVMQVATEFIPHLLNQLNSICEELSTDNDEVMEEAEYETSLRCLELILVIIHRLINWSELKSPDHKEILIVVMKQLGSSVQQPPNSITTPGNLDVLQQYTNDAFKYFQDFASRLPTASLAILFHKILIKITELSPDPSKLAVMSGEIARGFASRQWSDVKKLNSDSVIYLVQKDIRHSPNPMERITSYVTDIISPDENQTVDLNESYPLFNNETLPYFYKALFMELVEILRYFHPGNFESNADIMSHITKTVVCFQNFVLFIKIKHKRAILSVALKYGRNFIDLFLKKMLPLMDKNFSTYREEIISIIGTFQKSTRRLQALCNHVKGHKESQLAAMVPLVKRSLEIVIFQVKAMIQNNGCPPEMFFLGELKHRDIEGQEITSYQNEEVNSGETADANETEDDENDDTPAAHHNNLSTEKEFDTEENEEGDVPVKPSVSLSKKSSTRKRKSKTPDESEDGEGDDDAIPVKASIRSRKKSCPKKA